MRVTEAGLMLVALGVIMMFAGAILLALAAVAGGGQVSGGLVIFIGPLPIAVSWGPSGHILLLVAVLLALGMILITYLFLWRVRRQVEVVGIGPSI